MIGKRFFSISVRKQFYLRIRNMGRKKDLADAEALDET